MGAATSSSPGNQTNGRMINGSLGKTTNGSLGNRNSRNGVLSTNNSRSGVPGITRNNRLGAPGPMMSGRESKGTMATRATKDRATRADRAATEEATSPGGGKETKGTEETTTEITPGKAMNGSPTVGSHGGIPNGNPPVKGKTAKGNNETQIMTIILAVVFRICLKNMYRRKKQLWKT